MQSVGGWIFTFLFLSLNLLSGKQDYSELIFSCAILSLLFSLLFFLLKLKKTAFFSIITALALLLTAKFSDQKNRFLQVQEKNAAPGRYQKIAGQISRFPQLQANSTTLLVRVFCLNEIKLKPEERFTVQLRIPSRINNLTMLDFIECETVLQKPDLFSNFISSPAENLPLARGIAFYGHLKSRLLIERTKEAPLPLRFFHQWRCQLRRTIEHNLAKPAEKKFKAFLFAILLGDRSELEAEVKEQMITAGVYHFFAISGAHIGILALTLLKIFSLLKMKKRTGYLLTAIFSLLYFTISGFETTAARAVLMLLLYLLSKALFQKISPYNLLAIAALIIIFVNPASFLDPSFLLTFSISFAIITGREIFLPFLKKLPSNLQEFISASLSAYLISLPLSIYFFNRCSLLSLFSTALLSPLVSIIISLSFLLIFASALPLFAETIFFLLKPFLLLFFKSGDLFSLLQQGVLWQKRPALITLIFLLSSFSALARIRNIKLKLLAAAVFLAFDLLIVAGLNLSTSGQSPEAEFYLLDLKGSEAMLLKPADSPALLFDCGGAAFGDSNYGRTILLPFLTEINIKPEKVFLSHFHADHCRGLIEMFPFFKPKKIFISGEDEKNYYFLQLQKLKPKTSDLETISSGFSFSGKNFTARLLWPEHICRSSKNLNACSQVWLLKIYSTSFLLTGDIDRSIEERLLELYPGLHCNILKLAHHGSSTSGSPLFLEKISPEMVLIANRTPFRRDSELFQLFRKLRINWLETSTQGAIQIKIDNNGYRFARSKD